MSRAVLSGYRQDKRQDSAVIYIPGLQLSFILAIQFAITVYFPSICHLIEVSNRLLNHTPDIVGRHIVLCYTVYMLSFCRCSSVELFTACGAEGYCILLNCRVPYFPHGGARCLMTEKLRSIFIVCLDFGDLPGHLPTFILFLISLLHLFK